MNGITRVEFSGKYPVVVENKVNDLETTLGIDGWSLMFDKKQEVVDLISTLTQALEFWEYDD